MTVETLFNEVLKCLMVTDIVFSEVSGHTSPFKIPNVWSVAGFRGVVLGHSGQFLEFSVWKGCWLEFGTDVWSGGKCAD
jgi:hypothetical protein